MNVNLSRRDLLRLGVGGVLLGSGITANLMCGAGRNRRGYPILDAHIHIPSDDGDIWQWYPVMETMDDVVKYLDQVGVDRGIITSVASERSAAPADFIRGNREVIKYSKKHNGRFIPGLVINRNYPEESIREIEECYEKHGVV